MHRRSEPSPRNFKPVGIVLLVVVVLVLAAGLGTQGLSAAPKATPTLSIPPGPPFKAPTIQAQAASLLVGGAPVLMQQSATPLSTGSTPKLMAAYVLLTQNPGELSRTFTITRQQVNQTWQQIYQNDKELKVKAGQKYTGRALLEAALMASDNNAITWLAEAYPGGMKAFVAAMNQSAQNLGLQQTHFADPTGLSSSDQSSAADAATLAAKALALPEFESIVSAPSANLIKGMTIQNDNTLIGQYPGAVGVKTAFTTQGGHSLIFAARRSLPGGTVLVVGAVFHESSSKAAYKDGAALMDAGFSSVHKVTVPAGKPAATVDWGDGVHTTLSPTHPVSLVVAGSVKATGVTLSGNGKGTLNLTSGAQHFAVPVQGKGPPFWLNWLRALPSPLRSLLSHIRL